jgi:hypothetical protein
VLWRRERISKESAVAKEENARRVGFAKGPEEREFPKGVLWQRKRILEE